MSYFLQRINSIFTREAVSQSVQTEDGSNFVERSNVPLPDDNVNSDNNSVIIDVEKTLLTSSSTEIIDNKQQKDSNTSSCSAVSFSTVLLATLVLISIVLGRQYVKDILIYIDSLDLWQSTVLFAVMYTVVSFPIMWGYVLLNIACGYTYGFFKGTLMTCGCVTYAITCAHLIIGRFFKSYVERTYVTNEQTKALMNVVSGPNGYKIVFLTRFTPIPFGLQNAIFAVSGIRTLPYLLSSVCGLLVTQSVYAYMGSTLRSIAEVFSDENSITAWILLSLQILITVGLTIFILKLAKHELDKNIPVKQEAEGKLETKSRGIQTNPLSSHNNAEASKAIRTHHRNMSVNIPPISVKLSTPPDV